MKIACPTLPIHAFDKLSQSKTSKNNQGLCNRFLFGHTIEKLPRICI
jgi:hypothetical protein